MPSWLKWGYLAFVVVLVPAYAAEHGLRNFLWFSNVALLLGLAGVWRESRWVLSTQAVSVSLLEMGWIAAFLIGLARGGRAPFGITGYMFDETTPLLVRALSLYHLVLPFVLLWSVWRLGYDRRALRTWTPIGWAIVLLTFAVTPPDWNINWVYGWATEPQNLMSRWAWLTLVLLAFAGVWGLTHLLILRTMRRRGREVVG